MLNLLDEAKLDTIKSEIDTLRQSPNQTGLRRFFEAITKIDGSKKELLLSELLRCATKRRSTRQEYRWIPEISNLHPGDIGVLCVLLLNLVKLEPGQAMFCAAGDLHAYLDGFAVELMANSDNVLRGGLTSKHVDVPELMKTLTFRTGDVEILEPRNGRYVTLADEFELSILEVGKQATNWKSRGFEILLNVAGEAAVSDPAGSRPVPLPRGASVAIPAAIRECTIAGPATIYIAGVPAD
jgi:mannose-6-phosphate isomerase